MNSYDISELTFDIYSESVKGAPKFKWATKFLFYNCHKTLLRYIFQAYLWHLRRFCEGIIKDFEAPNWIYFWFYTSAEAIN